MPFLLQLFVSNFGYGLIKIMHLFQISLNSDRFWIADKDYIIDILFIIFTTEKINVKISTIFQIYFWLNQYRAGYGLITYRFCRSRVIFSLGRLNLNVETVFIFPFVIQIWSKVNVGELSFFFSKSVNCPFYLGESPLW